MGLKPAPFAYAKARSVAAAIELLASNDARLLAGGQSLIATLNMRLSQPALLVDINGIAGLDRIALTNAHIEIGTLVRYAQAERSPEIARAAPRGFRDGGTCRRRPGGRHPPQRSPPRLFRRRRDAGARA